MHRTARSQDGRRRDEEQKAGSLTPDVSRSGSPSPGARRSHWNRHRPNRIVLLVLGLTALLLLETVTRSTRAIVVDLAYLFRFKLLDRSHAEQWTSPLWALVGLRTTPCSLRKEPLVFVRGDATVAIVWESNACQDGQDWRLRWRQAASTDDWQSAPVHVTTVELNRLVHTTLIEAAHAKSRIDYELALSSPHGRLKRKRKHTFAWHRPDRNPYTLNIACVADNQFNVRAFRRILLRLASFGRSGLSTSYFAPGAYRRPDLLLHAGDVVQDPDNHAQWQTDFWDALTRGGLGYPLGQETPLLLARGNHDWDVTGTNVYTGGPGLRANSDWSTDFQDDELSKRGTYLAYSPHPRMRIVVLDSNLPTDAEQLEQERWLLWELGQPSWTEASLKVAVVHTAPWIEWWDRRAWTEGGESRWSAYVRERLVPLLSRADCMLVLSGHSHAYTRGFVPHELVPALTRSDNSTSLARDLLTRLRTRPWQSAITADDRLATISEPGLVAVTFGGAGGTLDKDRVEDWHVMDRSLDGRYHFGWMSVSFGGRNGQEAPAVAALDAIDGETRVYEQKNRSRCGAGQQNVRDVVEWRAVGIEGDELDRFFLVGHGCQ